MSSGAPASTVRRFDRRLYTGIAIVAAAVVLVGFAPTFYLRMWFSVWLTYVVVAIPIAIDTWRHRRLHPAFAWGGALFLISSRVALHVALSKPWIDFALRTFA